MPLLVTFAVTSLTFAGLYFFTDLAYSDMETPVIKGNGEYILNDEFSLWHSSFNSGFSTYEYEPVRVREYGASYFHRTNWEKAAFGRRFGEIVLNEDNGSLLYLPRKVLYDNDDILKFYFRSDNENAAWQASIYKTDSKVATVTAQTPGVKNYTYYKWKKVEIPFSVLDFKSINTDEVPHLNSKSDEMLQYYKPKTKYFYGVEFSLENGKKGDRFYFDRISLKKTERTQENMVTGIILGDKDEQFTVNLITDQGSFSKTVKGKGRFEIELPPAAKMAEIFIENNSRMYSPRNGRYIENGSYIPIRIFIPSDEYIASPPKEGEVDNSTYMFDSPLGVHLTPNRKFLMQTKIDGKIATAAEHSANNYGFTDAARRPENPDNAFRVMILGDDNHMGLHINQADIFTLEAAGLLNIYSHTPVELINASSKYSSFTNSWPIFKEYGALLSPDLVLLPIFDPRLLIETIPEYMAAKHGGTKGHNISFHFGLDENGALIELPNSPDWKNQNGSYTKEELDEFRKTYLPSSYTIAEQKDWPEWLRQNIKINKLALKKFKALAEERDQKIAILYISRYGRGMNSKYSLKDVEYDQSVFLNLIKDMASEANIDVIDVSEEIYGRKFGKNDGYLTFKSNGHFTNFGHFRYGHALARAINSYLPPNQSFENIEFIDSETEQ